MISKRVTVNKETGVDMPLAAEISKKAVQFKSHISICTEDGSANAKSLLSVLGSGLEAGAKLEIRCDGVDENKAITAICQILEK